MANNLRDDAELCALFKAECDENLQRIDSALLRLEEDSQNRPLIEELFRDAHTLKGSAGMVGANEIQAVAHRFEDLLGGARRGEAPLPPETIGRLYRAVDIMRKLVEEVVAGVPSGIDIWQALSELHTDARSAPLVAPPEPGGPAAPGISAGTTAAVAEPVGGPADRDDGAAVFSANADGLVATPRQPAAASAALVADIIPVATVDGRTSAMGMPATNETAEPARGFAIGSLLAAGQPAAGEIETIRVDARKLDALMAPVGELTVAAARSLRRVMEIERVADLWDELGRELAVHRVALAEMLHRASSVDESLLRRLADRLLTVQESIGERMEQGSGAVARLQKGLAEDGATLSFLAETLGDGIREIRMLAFSTLFNLFPRMVRDLAYNEGKQVHLVIEGGEITVDKRVLDELKDPLMHMLRNAIDHGIETPGNRLRAGKHAVGTIHLKAYRTLASIIVEMSDDGHGIDPEAVARGVVERGLRNAEEVSRMTVDELQGLIFASGVSTRGRITDISGRGIGMDVVRANVERLKGSVHLESMPGSGCTIRLQLPRTLATLRVLTLDLAGQVFALPVDAVLSSLLVSAEEVLRMEGREMILFGGEPVPVARLADILEIPSTPHPGWGNTQGAARMPCVILLERGMRFGLFVDDLVDEQEVIVKHDQALLKHVRTMAGAAILASGSICILLNPGDLRKSLYHGKMGGARQIQTTPEPPRVKVILLVEDSITTRTQMKRILDGAGYEVVTAVDGVDGLAKFRARSFDAVISDVQMPNMDGLTLTTKIRQSKEQGDLPVILVTSLSRDDDRRRGMEVGANAYLTKPAFDQKVLLDTLRRLL